MINRRLLSVCVSVLLSVSTFLALIPQTETIVYAAGTGKDLQLGASALTPVMTSVQATHDWDYKSRVTTAQTVYYGTSGHQAWHVIGYNGTGAVIETGTVTLFATDILDEDKPYKDDGTSNEYGSSDIKDVVDGFYSSLFSEHERNAIQGRTLTHGDPSYDYSNLCDGISDNDPVDAKIWLLSLKEADLIGLPYRVKNHDYWLRSPGEYDFIIPAPTATAVTDEGRLSRDRAVLVHNDVCAAFNLDSSSIIFTSDAADIKSSGAAGTLRAPVDHITDKWKLTVKDTGMTVTGGTVTRSGSTVTVPYTVTGAHDRISVFISDKAWNADGAVLKYYGELDTSAGGNTGSFTLPEDYDPSWKVYLLAEKINGNTLTDYASIPVEIIMPKVATPTFTPDAGTYSTAQNVKISCDTDGAMIHYTTDGSTPTDASATYNGPIIISDTTTVKAIAVKAGWTGSSVASAKYTISDEPVAVTGVSVSPTEATLKPDATKKLTATVEPDDATDKYVTWRSDDESVATVDETGVVTAIAEGDATITVTTHDGGYTATCKVTVSNDAPVVETCTISFDRNGGKGDMDDQTVDKGVKTQLNKNRFTRDGYSFDEWNTEADGSGKSYEDKGYITATDDTTLYAQWTKDKPKPEKDDDEENEEPSKPAAVNPDTIEGFFAVGGQPVPGVAMGKTVQGVAAQAVLNATRPTGYMQAFTFNMAVNGKVEYTPKNGVLTIIIPKELRKAGRTFAIMALDKNGRAWTYADTDTNPNTLTATINVEGYAFALIYKD